MLTPYHLTRSAVVETQANTSSAYIRGEAGGAGHVWSDDKGEAECNVFQMKLSRGESKT